MSVQCLYRESIQRDYTIFFFFLPDRTLTVPITCTIEGCDILLETEQIPSSCTDPILNMRAHCPVTGSGSEGTGSIVLLENS